MTLESDFHQAESATSLLATKVVRHLVGVIDLKEGKAVHAVAGRRDRYQPVQLGVGSRGGEPCAVLDHYRMLGLRRLYIADLDAIGARRPQSKHVQRLIESAAMWDEVLVDVGWTGENVSDLESYGDLLKPTHDNLAVVAATESARSVDAVARLADLVSPQRVFLSLDYRDGRLVGELADESNWVSLASGCEIAGMIVLDLATVGTARGASTREICERVRSRSASLRLYSGGGIRNAQHVQELQQSGCDACLVATALLHRR